jgi:hypothetical protein
MRQKDLRVLQRQREKEMQEEAEQNSEWKGIATDCTVRGESRQKENLAGINSGPTTNRSTPDHNAEGGSHLRDSEIKSSGPASSPQDEERYDETLLAVVGILDAIKGESNVAGWIRAGGLWGDGSHGRHDETSSDQHAGGRSHEGESAVEYVPGNDAEESVQVASPPPSSTVVSKSPYTMWFQRRETLEYWATRGRTALRNLGIEIEPGI